MGDIELLSWNYKDTPEAFSEIIKHDPSYFENIMEENGIGKYVLLITCNRVEIYFSGNGKVPIISKNPIYIKYPESIRHLFMVSSGLESMALGENDILRQIKTAYDLSSKRKHMDKFLSYTFQKALSVGKDVRTRTDISHGKTSLSTISLDIVEKNYGLKNKKIAIVGTGKMAVSLLNYLSGSGSSVTVAGRSPEHARNLAILYGASYTDLSEVHELIESNDIIITATSSKNYIIRKSHVENIEKPKIMVDLSNPPNIEKNLPDNISLYDLDMIYRISSETKGQRRMEIQRSREIIDGELEIYKDRINQMKSDDIISLFYRYSGEIMNEEIDELKRKINITDDQEKVIKIMMNSFTNKLLAPYTSSMKNFIKNNENYSYILREYDTMLDRILTKKDKKIIK
ncbi:MAG: glutamyl-tRNA reductase [Ferroplasma sp.]|uniref:glutamyl-tRNA reductase n=1 Tax=Ferroplasma sp. TaxID=2591003 RepID=UPI002814DCD9|nr:glutamyl-tRNA reductase [Ferroplasma sp.]WMT50835.1 MAG: glutamyl-tRNA reductase [Ferroplasma sp.]